MATQIYKVCDGVTVPADAVTYNYPITSSQQATNVGPYSQITFLVSMPTPGGQGPGINFAIQVSPNGTNWFDAYIHNVYNAAANKWILVANITVAAAMEAALFALSNPSPYVRVTATNLGAADATVTVWAVVNR